jgi:adenylate cyclase
VNVALGVRMSEVSRNRGDARLFLVSLVFLSSAGFLLLHALATPDRKMTLGKAGSSQPWP